MIQNAFSALTGAVVILGNLLIGFVIGWLACESKRKRQSIRLGADGGQATEPNDLCLKVVDKVSDDTDKHSRALHRLRVVLIAEQEDDSDETHQSVRLQIRQCSLANKKYDLALAAGAESLSGINQRTERESYNFTNRLGQHRSGLQRFDRILDQSQSDESAVCVGELLSEMTALREANNRLKTELNEAVRRLAEQGHRLQLTEQEALHDALTKLPNRRALDARLTELWSLFERKDRVFSVILFDLDKFKQVNDAFGHTAGDAVLKVAARVLTATVRSYDFVARYGGEEFAVLLPETPSKTAISIADRIRRQFSQSQVVQKDFTISFTASAGVATSSPGDTCSDVILRADGALYAAKDSGRNTTRFFDTIIPSATEMVTSEA